MRTARLDEQHNSLVHIVQYHGFRAAQEVNGVQVREWIARVIGGI